MMRLANMPPPAPCAVRCAVPLLGLLLVQEPPVAATDPGFDAIVVSEETIPGALEINRVRSELGFQPLAVLVVGLVFPRRSAIKLSSTDLRAADAG